MGGFGSRMLTEFPEPGQPVQVDGPVQPASEAALWTKAQQAEAAHPAPAQRLQEQLKAAVESEKITRKPPASGMSFAPCPQE